MMHIRYMEWMHTQKHNYAVAPSATEQLIFLLGPKIMSFNDDLSVIFGYNL